MYIDSMRLVLVQPTTPLTTTELPVVLFAPFRSTASPASLVNSVTEEVIQSATSSDVFALIMGIITLILLVAWTVRKVVKYRSRLVAAAHAIYRKDVVIAVVPPPPTTGVAADMDPERIQSSSTLETANLAEVRTPHMDFSEPRNLPAPMRDLPAPMYR